MGLPVWRVPSPEAHETLKSDVTAPARSPIRRRSPPWRRARPARAHSPRLFDETFLPAAPGSQRAMRGQREPSRHPRSALRANLPPPPVPESPSFRRRGDVARDAYQRSIYDFASSPNRASARPFHPFQPLPAYTPNFAPAAAARESRPESSDALLSTWTAFGAATASRREHAGDAATGTASLRDDDASDNAVTLPPLRRMGRRTIADGPLPSSSLRESWSPATSLDGLGDRDRSISPVDDDGWDTFLSTVAPDPLAPTADSSFTSAAASASFTNSSNPASRAGSSNSNSAASYHTHLTVPSRHDSPPNDLFLRACESSDSDTASDTEAEADEDDFRLTLPPRNDGFHRRMQERLERRQAESDSARPSRIYRHDTSSLGRRYRQLARPLNDQIDEHAEEGGTRRDDQQILDQELRDARAILERLAQRGNIPNEFWASVGLTRSMADGVALLQQREDES